jgi:hypothetical protein
LTIAITRQVGCLHDACRHARAKQFSVPRSVITAGDLPRVGTAQDLLDTRLYRLESLPVAAYSASR